VALQQNEVAMWVAVHLYVTFKAKAVTEKKILVEENVVLLNVDSHEAVYGRLDELQSMYGLSCVYPGYETVSTLSVRKIVSISSVGEGDAALPPVDKTEITYELYEFSDDAALDNFVKSRSICANMEELIIKDR
jgi:hypothetical protein